MALKNVLFVLAALGLISNSYGLTPAQQVEVDRVIEDVFMADNRVPGMALTIVESSGVAYAKGYGFSNVAENVVANQDTKFCIASITKTFTATLVMKVLSEKFPELGALALETPIVKLHPTGNFTFIDRYRSESMSFRDLLSHRHGLQTETMGSGAGAFKDIEEYTFRTRYAPSIGPFRVAGYYSNTLYAMAGKLIAEIAEQPYTVLLQELFDALRMSDSVLISEDLDLDSLEGMSKGYFLMDGVVTEFNSSLINRVFVGAPAGGIITTSIDMAKYINFHLNLGKVGNTQVISEEAMLWLRHPAFAFDDVQFKTNESALVSGSYAFGTGFQLSVLDGWRYVTHSGQWTTFMSELRIYPELSFGTFTVNNGPINLYDAPFNHPYVHNEIFAIVHGSSRGAVAVDKPNKANKTSTKSTDLLQSRKSSNLRQESFVGVFGHPVEGELEISNPNGTLYIQYGKWATGFLLEYPDMADTFVVNWDGDFVQDFYFATGGTLLDIYIQFLDIDTLNIVFGESLFEFQRGVGLDTLPLIPWDPNSCA